MTTNNFKGIVALTEEQYEELVRVGSININGETIIYSPKTTTYVTPEKFDDELNDTSTNAVENKVIKKYVDEQIDSVKTQIMEEVTIDNNTITKNSENQLQAIGLMNEENNQVMTANDIWLACSIDIGEED